MYASVISSIFPRPIVKSFYENSLRTHLNKYTPRDIRISLNSGETETPASVSI